MSVAKRVVVVTAVVVALLMAAPTAHADTPPGYAEGTGWVDFTLGPTAFPGSRTPTTYPVTLFRQSGGGFDPLTLGWEEDGLENPVWWTDLTVSGYHLVGGGCPAEAPSCGYDLSGASGTFLFRGGDRALPESPLPAAQTVMIPPPPVMNVVIPSDLRPTPAAVGAPGTVTIDLSGSSDGGNPLTYSWILTKDGAEVASGTAPTETIPLTEDGNYGLSVTVTSGFDGYSETVTSEFSVSGMVAPAPTPTPGPKPSPAPESGSGSPAPTPAPTPAPIPSVVDEAPVVVDEVTFAPLRQVPSALNGGRNGEAQVIWLWRPDWFKPDSLGPRAPQTRTPPKVKVRQTVAVSSNGPVADPSATPWLAGLAVFGLAGLGLMAMRRRRLHHLDP